MPMSTDAPFRDIIRAAIRPTIARLAKVLAGQIAELTAARLEAEVGRRAPRPRGRPGHKAARGRPALTRWVADRRARRVPTFVIAATGLSLKKDIVDRFGENAVFEKGKPAPSARVAAPPPPSVVKAKPPVIRRAARA